MAKQDANNFQSRKCHQIPFPTTVTFKIVIGGSVTESISLFDIGAPADIWRTRMHLHLERTADEREILAIPKKRVLHGPTSQNFNNQWNAMDMICVVLNPETCSRTWEENEVLILRSRERRTEIARVREIGSENSRNVTTEILKFPPGYIKQTG